ncbi:pyridoxamine 5'-phosphate oxidase family protein [Rhodoblastus sp. 17X3]|uniref:pyridoxamine 5'-phosphate oxidase family protein n=1 Tax=Rhodoblastus sp. 17X3 TaxID=3047026 RepID=UPI0024B773EA|nr:pyridoxamine 5'-phosphate oxidase family protein [Rhodoblastus sp. 17X3]MDI9848201.1 pyridoxamine 5'-phosphate oxidase family protein [Rhodoblastus sp. 17X3]
MATPLPDRPLPDRRPWHEGEEAARRAAGAPEIGPVIRTALSAQQRDFFARLPLVFVAGLDKAGHPAASLLRGAPGFLTCPEPHHMEIAARLPSGERLLAQAGAAFALIGVDFAARRRNRVNGRVAEAHAGGFELAVEEAFGNCPKYIAPRTLFPGADDPGGWTELPVGGDAMAALITKADVFFIASRGPDGVDMSHRGGPPGFVRLGQDGVLQIPDFPGNNYFNTFGNLLHDPRAALLFVDFPGGRALHLAGEARPHLSPDARFWTFAPRAARLLTAVQAFGGPASAF